MSCKKHTSIKRLGACLLQDEKPVYFASKALTEVQKGCVTIEIESLAVAWVGEVSPFLVCNPLYIRNTSEAIGSYSIQSLNQATPRLQRILIRAFPYHFTVHYIPCVTNYLADCLSRLGGQKDTINYLNSICIRSLTNSVQEVTI